MVEQIIREAFIKVKKGFDLPFEVILNFYKTRKEAENNLDKNIPKTSIEEHEFAFSWYDGNNSSVTFIQENWPLKNHPENQDCLEAVMAEDFGHLEYDSTHEDLTEVHVHPELSMHVYQFWAVRFGIEAGFGDQLFEFYKIGTVETKPLKDQTVDGAIGVYPVLAALSEKYDVQPLVKNYNNKLSPENKKGAEKYKFLLNPKNYDNESQLLKSWKSAKCSS